MTWRGGFLSVCTNEHTHSQNIYPNNDIRSKISAKGQTTLPILAFSSLNAFSCLLARRVIFALDLKDKML